MVPDVFCHPLQGRLHNVPYPAATDGSSLSELDFKDGGNTAHEMYGKLPATIRQNVAAKESLEVSHKESLYAGLVLEFPDEMRKRSKVTVGKWPTVDLLYCLLQIVIKHSERLFRHIRGKLPFVQVADEILSKDSPAALIAEDVP